MGKINQDDILYTPQLVQQQRDGVCLLIDPVSPNWASVNSIGSEIIRHCDGRHTLQELSSILMATGLSPEDVNEFVNQAAGVGMISNAPDLSPAYRGRHLAIAPKRLEELWISTNNACPLHCRHCLVDGGVEPKSPMTTAEIKKLVDEATDLCVKRIYFTGGEPFLRKDLLQLVEHVTQRTQLVILTSGVLITQEIASRLSSIANGNLLMQVSLEGPDAETSDLVRGEGSFDLAVQGIKALIGAGLTPIVTTTLTRLNYLKSVETTRFLAGLGVRDHHILWLHGRGRMRDNMTDLLLPGETVARVMEELRLAAAQSGIVVDNAEALAVRVRSKRGRKNDLCNSCYDMLSIDTSGHVYPCAALAGAEGFDCGSIREQSLHDIWLKSSVTGWIRENSVQKRVGCNTCYLKFFCGGGCFAQSYFAYEITQGEGCIMAADPYCEAYKTQLLELMWQEAMPEPGEKVENTPKLYRMMGNELAACAVGSDKVLDAAFDVGTYHCACVLAMDMKKT